MDNNNIDWGPAEYMVNGKTPWNKGDKYKSFIKGEATQTFPNITAPVPPPLWLEVEMCKSIGLEEVIKDEAKLIDLDVRENKRSFAGNKVIYNYFMAEMIKTRYKGGKTLQEQYEEDPMKIWEQVCKMDRRKARAPDATDIFELNRAVVFFKPSIAKYIYQRFNATGILDPCAGWGGRMLGAISLGIPYTGFDTNTNLHHHYDAMVDTLCKGWEDGEDGKKFKVGTKDCIKADFSKQDYDLVLTSPPYYDLEIYPHQGELGTEEEWYRKFLMPMIARSYKYMKKGGHCCINISPKMYKKMLGYGFPKCSEAIDFLQQKNIAQWGEGKGKQDFIYVWEKSLG
jgi:hypothetical protein